MTDRYEKIRKALAMGPTPGPWDEIQREGSRWTDIYQSNSKATPIVYVPPRSVLDENGIWKNSKDEAVANAKYVAACDPDTIRELLEERDADLKRLAFLSKEPVIEGFVGIPKDVYDYACDCAEECGRDEPNDEDMLNGMRRLIDAAIAAANGGGDE